MEIQCLNHMREKGRVLVNKHGHTKPNSRNNPIKARHTVLLSTAHLRLCHPLLTLLSLPFKRPCPTHPPLPSLPFPLTQQSNRNA